MTATMSSTRPPLGPLAQGVFSDLRTLGRDYLALGGARATTGLREAKLGLATLSGAGVFGVLFLAQAIFAAVAYLVGTTPGVVELTQIVAIAAAVALVLAVVLGLMGVSFLRRATFHAKRLMAIPLSSDDVGATAGQRV